MQSISSYNAISLHYLIPVFFLFYFLPTYFHITKPIPIALHEYISSQENNLYALISVNKYSKCPIHAGTWNERIELLLRSLNTSGTDAKYVLPLPPPPPSKSGKGAGLTLSLRWWMADCISIYLFKTIYRNFFKQNVLSSLNALPLSLQDDSL